MSQHSNHVQGRLVARQPTKALLNQVGGELLRVQMLDLYTGSFGCVSQLHDQTDRNPRRAIGDGAVRSYPERP